MAGAENKEDCYVCVTDLQGYSQAKSSTIASQNTQSTETNEEIASTLATVPDEIALMIEQLSMDENSDEYETSVEDQNEEEYAEHDWEICGNLKIISILLGQQSDYTKYPCFMCLWNSRDRDNHYKKGKGQREKN